MLFKNVKKSTSFLIILVILSALVVAAYAASLLFFNSDPQTSDYSKKDIFEFTVNEFFTESGGFGPGESKSINPIVTSDASIDSYAVIVVEMPKYSTGGLYTINNIDQLRVAHCGYRPVAEIIGEARERP